MKVFVYCRLSRDEDKENYASIEEQKIILQYYAMSRGWKILDRDFYIDDNFSESTRRTERLSPECRFSVILGIVHSIILLPSSRG